jgi:hypothetical protein
MVLSDPMGSTAVLVIDNDFEELLLLVEGFSAVGDRETPTSSASPSSTFLGASPFGIMGAQSQLKKAFLFQDCRLLVLNTASTFHARTLANVFCYCEEIKSMTRQFQYSSERCRL